MLEKVIYAKYQGTGSLKLILLQNVCQNTITHLLSLYILKKNQPIILKLYEENCHVINVTVLHKVTNFRFKPKCRFDENQMKTTEMQPISKSLYQMQKENCSILNAVHLSVNLVHYFFYLKLDKTGLKTFDVWCSLVLNFISLLLNTYSFQENIYVKLNNLQLCCLLEKSTDQQKISYAYSEDSGVNSTTPNLTNLNYM